MSKKAVRLALSFLVIGGFILSSCSPALTTTEAAVTTIAKTTPATTTAVATKTTAAETPKYGGVLMLVEGADLRAFDDTIFPGPVSNGTVGLTHQDLWGGDWAKGPAGGYGTGQASWMNQTDIWDLKGGLVAESWEFKVDSAKDEASIVIRIRQGMRWGLNSNSEASRLVNGREITADDVAFSLKQATSDKRFYVYQSHAELRDIPVQATGKYEVTVELPALALPIAKLRLFDTCHVVPPEVYQKYGDMRDWRNSVGTGPFILLDFVSNSQATLVRNPNYYMKDPVGPGKGNQLPYLDGVKLLIIPDASTRLAGLRTAKIDRMAEVAWEDAAETRRTAADLSEATGGSSAGFVRMCMRMDKAPFNDVRVRRAMMMAIDFGAIRKDLNNGLGLIVSAPYEYLKEYSDLYVGLDDPQMPASVKELYTYSPEKAKSLLKEAGYPNGFKTSIVLESNASAQVDYASIIKYMWDKVGIGLDFDLKEAGAYTNIQTPRTWDAILASGNRPPVSTFYTGMAFTGTTGPTNISTVDLLKDSYVIAMVEKIKRAAVTDQRQAMRLQRELSIYALDQAFVIISPCYQPTVFWWPWLKNYSGEQTVGYFNGHSWAQWIWIDQNLKEKMTGRR